MKEKVLASMLGLSVAFSFAPLAFANDRGEQESGRAPGVTTQRERDAQDASRLEDEDKNDHSQATSTATSTEDRDVEDGKDDHGKGDEHRSSVSEIVKKLLGAADRSGGIGDEVRDVAREQASSTEDTVRAMDDLDTESRIKRFFFGPDFKSLGDLRSSIVTTQNSIDRLTTARDRATSSSTKEEIDSQISALKGVASTTESFVTQHEDVFSLFGWFVKLFND